MLAWLAEHQRRTLCLMQSARQCRVRAYLKQGVRPHINQYGVRYTSPVLATSTHLIGQHLLIYMNADDLRSVRAFLADGMELGVLEAQGAWRVVPHNLRLRQEILKQAGVKQNKDVTSQSLWHGDSPLGIDHFTRTPNEIQLSIRICPNENCQFAS